MRGLLLPKNPSDRAAANLKKLRSCAALLVREVGDVVLGDIDELWMRTWRVRLVEDGRLGRDLPGAAWTLLRKLAFRAQVRGGGTPRLAWRLRAGRRAEIGEPHRRPLPDWDDVARMVADGTVKVAVRAAVALQAHTGLRPGQVLSLRVGDLDPQNHLVQARVPGPGGRWAVVTYAIPHDAWAAVRLLLRQRPDAPTALLFPKRGAPAEPCPGINKAIRREAARLGIEAFTLQDLRRLAQAMLIEMGARREQVRGSARRGRSGRLPLSQQALELQRGAWLDLRGQVYAPPSQRAPRKCAADQPERRFRRRKRAVERLPDTLLWRGAERPAKAPTAAAEPLEADPFAASEAEVQARMQRTSLPRDWSALPTLPPPPAQPAPVVHHTTVHRYGYSQADLDAALHQGVATGVSLEVLLRRRGAEPP